MCKRCRVNGENEKRSGRIPSTKIKHREAYTHHAIRFTLLFFMMIISLIGCGQSMLPLPPPDIPENNQSYCYGYGISDKTKEDALRAARVDFAARLGVFIHSEGLILKIEKNGEYSEHTEEKVVQLINQSIPEHDYDYFQKGDFYYGLVKVRRKKLEASVKKNQQLVSELYEKAQDFAKQGKLTRAIRKYIESLSAAEKFLTGDKNMFDMDGDGKLDLAAKHVKNELASYFDSIRMDKLAGDSQVGELKKNLPNKFKVRVYSTLWGKNPVGVQVTFSYQNGTGILELPSGERSETVQGSTDLQGELECLVISVNSITDRNAVVAQIDLSHFLSTLDSSVIDIAQYLMPLSEKKVIFSYRSKFTKEGDSSLILKLNGSAGDQVFENGEKVTLEVASSSNFRFVHLLHVSSLGEIKYVGSVNLHNDSEGSWKVRRKDTGGVLTIENITLGSERDVETEAFVAIAAPIDLRLKSGIIEKDVLFRTLKDKTDDQWAVGQICYKIQ